MLKNLYKKFFGSYENLRIENVNVLGDTTADVVCRPPGKAMNDVYRPPYPGYSTLFPSMVIIPSIPREKFTLVKVEARRGDGSVLNRIYDIPSYCADGIIRHLKNYEGAEVKVKMRNKLPRRLPHKL